MYKTCTYSLGCSSTHPISHFCSACIRSQWCQPFQNHSWRQLWQWGNQHVLCQTIQLHTHGNLNKSKKKKKISFLHQYTGPVFFNHRKSFNSANRAASREKTWITAFWWILRDFCSLFCCCFFICGERGLGAWLRVTISRLQPEQPR